MKQTPGPLIYLCLFLLSSCRNDVEEYEALQGANERIQNLLKVIKERESVIEDLRRQIKQERQENEEDTSDTEDECEQRLVELQMQHREDRARLEGLVGSLHLELGTLQWEKIVLEDLLAAEPKIEEARDTCKAWHRNTNRTTAAVGGAP